VAVFASDATDICHVTAVPADSQTPFARDFTLLLGAHRCKPAPALLRSAGPRFGSGRSTSGCSASLAAPAGLRTAPIASASGLGLGSATRLRGRFVAIVHASTAAALATPTGGAIGLFGLDAVTGNGSVAAWCGDGGRLLPAIACAVTLI